MITALEAYMDALYTGMQPMPADDRLRIVQQTARRIKERAVRLNMREEDLIADMESPQETARKFVARWRAQQEKPAPETPVPEVAPEPAHAAQVQRSAQAPGIGRIILLVCLLPLLLPLMLLPVMLVVLGVLLPVTGVLGAVFSLLGLPLIGGVFALGMADWSVFGLVFRIFAGIVLFKIGRRVLRSLMDGFRSRRYRWG